MKYRLALIWLTSLNLFVFSLSAPGLTLHETMKRAFAQNPVIDSINGQIEAMEERTKAAWKRLWPRVSLTYNYSSQRWESFDGTTSSDGRNSQRGSSFQVSVNLYNGRADEYAALEKEASLKALKARLNATNSQNSATKGAIANLVAAAYFSMLAQFASIDLIKSRGVLLEKMLAQANAEDDRRAIQIQIDGLRVEYQNSLDDLEGAQRDYEFAVKEKAPDELDSFESVINEMRIPESDSEALDIASKKSPALNAARFEHEAEIQSRKSVDAELYAPKFGAFISRGQSTNWDNSPSYSRSRTTTYGLSLRIPIDFGAPNLSRAASLDETRAARKVEAEESELKYTLQSYYSRYNNQRSLLKTVQENHAKALADMQRLQEALDSGRPIDVKFALDRTFRNFDSTWGQLLNLRIKIANTKFAIQRTMGTLFEDIDDSVLAIERRRKEYVKD